MSKLQRVWRAVCAFAITMIATAAALGCVATGFVLVIVWQAERELPTPVAVRAKRLEQDVILVDRYGERMTAIPRGDAHREVVSISAMSPYLRDAVVASEDARFWTHHGIDPHGIARAFAANVLNGKKMQGGSTITQQLLKLFLLQGRPPLLRKVEEAMLASSFESLLTKEELLELYLNAVYLGEGNAGVGAAAQDLFGVSAAAVTPAEAALLIGAISAPSVRSPFCAPAIARQRQRQVLDRMVAERMMTADAAAAAQREPIRFRLAGDQPEMMDIASAVDAVGTVWPLDVDRVETTIDLPLEIAAARALRQGLQVYAKSRGEHRGPRFTIASGTRERWHEQLRQLRADLAAWGVGTNALLVYDLRNIRASTAPPAPCRYGSTLFRAAEPNGFASGLVIASSDDTATIDLGDITGTIGRKTIAWTGKSLSVVAPVGAVVDVRLPAVVPARGSTVAVDLIPRPIVEGAVVILNPTTREVLAVVGGGEASRGGYNRALRARRAVGSTVKPFVFASAISGGALEVSGEAHDVPYAYIDPWSGSVWEPANWYPDHLGTLPLAEAMARSVNMVAVEAVLTVGADRVATFLEEVSPVASIPHAPSIALGAFERTPLELAHAYAVLASGGMQGSLRTVRRVRHGDTAVDFPLGDARRILDPSLVQATDWLLTQPVEHPHGTARSLATLGLGIRGKTGTTNDARDAWFVGYARDLLVAVWVGYDQPTPLRGRRGEESGATLAVPIARAIFARAVAMRRIMAPLDHPVLPELVAARGPDASIAFRAAFETSEVTP
ncbi:MAG: transglycosylase domain-containing protein [bacterium]|nr:transglycosylase domain-containing protein [bacterium]